MAAMKRGSYDSCVHFYSNAFEVSQTSYLSTMRMAACAYSSENMQEYRRQLTKAFEIDWSGAREVFESYDEFTYLQGSLFEKEVMEKWTAAAEEQGVNIQLMKELAEIRQTDQEQRAVIIEYSNRYGWNSPKVDSLWEIQVPRDQANMARIAEIIDTNGYPGVSMVGSEQAITAFLVVQHSELSDQEKYLPVLMEAAEANELDWRSVALLIDRVNVRTGRKQIYGSQVTQDEQTGEHYFFPIEQPYKIDSIRAAIGLGPLQNYADNWQIIWDPERHLQRQKEGK